MDWTLTDFLRVLLGVQNAGSLKSFLHVFIACIEGFIQFIYSSQNLCEMGRAGLYLFATRFIPKPSLLRPLSSPQKNIPRKRIHFIIEDQLMKSPEVPYRQLMKVMDFSLKDPQTDFPKSKSKSHKYNLCMKFLVFFLDEKCLSPTVNYIPPSNAIIVKSQMPKSR